MKINGLTVDTAKIGQGLYEIICEKEEDHIVAFGMIPKWVMDMTEKEVRQKIMLEAAKQVGCNVEEIIPYLDSATIEGMVRPIMRQIGTEIYTAAAKAGRMVV